MRDKWRKISKEVHDNVTEILYQNEAYPGVLIVSEKVQVKNSSLRGFWEYTHFFVWYGGESKEFWHQKDAKEYVAKGEHHENHH